MICTATSSLAACDEALAPQVARVVAVDPNQFHVISRSVKKTEDNDARALALYSKLEGHENLTSIKGIGPLTGAILLSVIGHIHDFADEGGLAAYFGIVPRIQNSNETQRSDRITKRGSELGRTALVQCALIAQRYSPYLKQYYERIKARRGTGKAIIWRARGSV